LLASLFEVLRKTLSGELLNAAVRQCCTHAPVWLSDGHQHLLRLGLTDSKLGLLRYNGQEKGRIRLVGVEFEVGWGLEVQGAVEALAVVEGLDVIEDFGASLAVGEKDAAVNQFKF